MQVETVTPESEALSPETPGEWAKDFLLEVLDAMELDCDVEVEEREDGVWSLAVVGEGADELVGRHGDALNALQYLTSLAALKRSGEHARILLDAGGYRIRREAALTEQAMELAKMVAEAGQEAELDPLSSFERRIIHNALVDHPEVVTYSEGEEPERRVIIAPREKQA